MNGTEFQSTTKCELRSHPNALLSVVTLYAGVSFLLLCTFVSPPFLTTGDFDRASISTQVTDWIATILVVWLVAGAFLLRLSRQYPVLTRWIGWSLVLGIPAGILVLTGVFAGHSFSTQDAGIRRFWLSQAVGTFGIGWLFVLLLTWGIARRLRTGEPRNSKQAQVPRAEES
jgi:hypothetical protein